MGQLLDKIGLKVQIGLIGVIGVVIMIAVAALAYTSIEHQKTMQQGMDADTEANDLASAINAEMLQARRHEKDFFLRNDEKFSAEQQASVQNADSTIDRLTALLKREDELSLARTVKTKIFRYEQHFNEVVGLRVKLGLNENLGLMGQMRTAVHDIENDLKYQTDPQLKILMLTMRRDEKDFLARKDPKYADSLKKAAEEFTVELKAATMSEAVRAEILAKLAVYRDSFVAVAGAMASVADASKKMSETYATVEPVLTSLIKKTNDSYEAAKADIAEVRTEMVQFLIGILGGGVVLLIISVVIVRAVSDQVESVGF